MKDKKRYLREKIKDLPVNMGIGGLALLLGLAESGGALFDEILKGPRRGGLIKGLERMTKLKTPWDYYEELKDLERNSIRTILWRLKKRGLVKKRDQRYALTVAGVEVVRIFQKEGTAPPEWDGKWRIVMFDIPEKMRVERNWLRFQLLALDYKPLQKSVFIGKQPIDEDFYKELIERELRDCVRLLAVGEIDDDEALEKLEELSEL